MYGIFPGKVVNNIDPDKRGKIQVRVPQVYGTELNGIPDQHLPWAYPCLPFASKQSGLVVVPDVGAGVWVGFRQNDVKYPIWLGCWITAEEATTEHASGYNPTPENYLFKSPGGNMILISDLAAEPKIAVQDMANQSVTLLPNSKEVKVNCLGNYTETTTTTHEKQVGVSYKCTAGTNIELESGVNTDVKSGANLGIDVGGAMTTAVATTKNETVGLSYSMITGLNCSIISGLNMLISSGGLLTVSAAGAVAISALATLALTVAGACTLAFQAALTMNVAGTALLLANTIKMGVEAKAQKLTNKAFMDLFNTHTHLYAPGPGSPTPSEKPLPQAIELLHVTQNVEAS